MVSCACLCAADLSDANPGDCSMSLDHFDGEISRPVLTPLPKQRLRELQEECVGISVASVGPRIKLGLPSLSDHDSREPRANEVSVLSAHSLLASGEQEKFPPCVVTCLVRSYCGFWLRFAFRHCESVAF